jgi:hypothetical protein
MLAAAFDERCARLSAQVDSSTDTLAYVHAQRVERDKQRLESLSSDIAHVRLGVQGLSSDLQPRLERLLAAEPQHAVVNRATAGLQLGGPLGGPPENVRLQAAAATKLQGAWRRAQAGGRHALANVRYCPESLRRSFVLGIRQPTAASQAPAPAVLPPMVPSIAAISTDTGGQHFMSIL